MPRLRICSSHRRCPVRVFPYGGSDDALLKELGIPFDQPKPVELTKAIISWCSKGTDIVLDFFAGSGTLGHSVMSQNITDGSNRRYIPVQLPEPLDPANKDQKAAADFCDELSKPRSLAELIKELIGKNCEIAIKERRDYDVDQFWGDYSKSKRLLGWEPKVKLRDGVIRTIELYKNKLIEENN